MTQQHAVRKPAGELLGPKSEMNSNDLFWPPETDVADAIPVQRLIYEQLLAHLSTWSLPGLWSVTVTQMHSPRRTIRGDTRCAALRVQPR